MDYKFESTEEYYDWCESMVTKIYYANIAMKNESIREVVEEIASKLWLREGWTLIKD